MKKLLLFIFALIYITLSFSNPISKEQALKVAENFFIQKTKGIKSTSVHSVYTKTYNELNTIYIINYENGGFVVISADDRVEPILGYSDSDFAPEKNPSPEFEWWIENYSKQIEYAVKNNIDNEDATQKWTDINNRVFEKGAKAVSPLLTTTWNQSPGYNSYCPPGTPTGCVATAMAQIMKFWNFPATGVNWNTYNHSTYGEQLAYFNEGNYDWGNMPNNAGTDPVAWLMYHCGVAVDMDYDPEGSGAFSRDVPMVLANYFKYDQAIDFVERSEYSDPDWINLLKVELDAGRPVYYSGNSQASGGHAFVFDGYDNSDLFHVNWGWGGSSNGYFAIGDLTPSSYVFNDDNAAIIGIKPSSEGNEKFYAVQKFSGFSHLSELPSYIDGVDNKVAWAIGDDGSGSNLNFKDFIRTTDGGATWTGKTVSTTATAFSMISGVNADTAYIAAYGNSTSNKVLRTYDGGDTWSPILSGAGSSSFFNVVHFFNESDGFVQGDPEGNEFEVYTTIDGGDSWVRVLGGNIPDPITDEWGIVGHYTSVGDNVWFTTNKGRIFKSIDKGLTWNVYTVYSGTDDTGIEVAFDNTSLNGIANVSIDDVAKSIEYYSTTDGGENWTQIFPIGNFYDAGISSVPGEVNTFISVGSNYTKPKMGISFSNDRGETWTDVADYYQNYQMVSVDMVSSNKAYIGSFCGEWSGGMYIFGEPSAELFVGFTSSDASNHDSLYCINTDIIFSSNSVGLINSYDWDFGANASPSSATDVGPHTVQYISGGEKTVSLTVYDNDGSDVYTKTVYVADAVPNDIIEITGNGDVLEWAAESYSVTDQLYSTFVWNYTENNWFGESTTNSIDMSFGFDANSGVLECYAVNGCGVSNTISKDITITLTSVESLKSEFRIYPNPAYDFLTVSDIPKNSSIAIYDITGSLVYKNNIDSDSDKFVIDINTFKQGMYIVQISTESGIYSEKINITK